MCDRKRQRDPLGLDGRDTVSAAVLKLFGEYPCSAHDQIRIVKNVRGIEKIAAEQAGWIGQLLREVRLQRGDCFRQDIRHETYPALGAGGRFQTARAGQLNRLTGGLDIFADAGFCSAKQVAEVLQTVDFIRRFGQDFDQCADSFRTFHVSLPPKFVSL